MGHQRTRFLLPTFALLIVGCSGGGANIVSSGPPAPSVASLSPASATAGSPGFVLTVNGANFVSGAQVLWNTSARATSFVSATQLTAQINTSDLAAPGTASISVQNTSGSPSAGFSFVISALPSPSIATLSPASATAGSGAFTLTVNGANFLSTSQVQWNGAVRPTTFVSASQLTAQITAADVASAGTTSVIVQNPASASPASSFTVNNPLPSLVSLLPASALVGSGALSVTVNGSNFVSSSVFAFNNSARAATIVSASQATLQLTAADLATAGTGAISVTNPTPGGGSSSPLTFTVNNPAPMLASLSPSNAQTGVAALTLGVNGSGFVATSQVLWNGSARTTTFVSTTQLTAAIPAADLASAGSVPVTVTNPTPGGGISSPLSFSVGNPLPGLTAISPTNVVAGGSAFALTLTGSNFIASSTVLLNGTPRATTFLSASSLSAAITAADILTAGPASISVANPTPGGGTSAVVTLTIQQTANPVPTLASISPATVNAGVAAFTLSASGSNFVQGSTVLWNGSPRPTSFNSSSNLAAQITAADVASAGTANVSVSSPTPGGGTSPSVPFIVAVPPNPVPSITSLAPASAGANSGSFTLTVNGSSFVANSLVLWNGAPRATAFVSATQLSAAIPASDITAQGTAIVTVSNPAPGGGTSNSSIFTVGPQVNPLPTITSLTPPSTTITTSSLTIAIAGTGFLPNSTVQINGYTTFGTTYQSSNLLQFTIPSNYLSTVQTLRLTVTNPPPSGGTSLAVNFNVTAPVNSKFTFTTVNINANDIAWDSVHQTFYASTPSTAAPAGNSIIPFSPTGQIGTAVYAGSEPNTLAISDDDSKLYAMTTGSLNVQRFALPAIANDLTISIQPTPPSSFGPSKPIGLAVAPGAPRTVAIVRGDPIFSDGGAVIYDDATPRAKAQQQSTYSYSAIKDTVVWGADASKLYEAGQTFQYLTVMNVDSTGITSSTNYSNSYTYYGSGIHFDRGTGYIYDNQGHVTDPSNGLPVGSYSATGVMTTDSTLGFAYFIGNTNFGSTTYTLAAFDLRHFTPVATATLYGITGTPSRLIRFGSNGLALVTSPNSTYPNGPSQIYLINGSFVVTPNVIVNPFEGGVAMPQNTWDPPPPPDKGVPFLPSN